MNRTIQKQIQVEIDRLVLGGQRIASQGLKRRSQLAGRDGGAPYVSVLAWDLYAKGFD